MAAQTPGLAPQVLPMNPNGLSLPGLPTMSGMGAVRGGPSTPWPGGAPPSPLNLPGMDMGMPGAQGIFGQSPAGPPPAGPPMGLAGLPPSMMDAARSLQPLPQGPFSAPQMPGPISPLPPQNTSQTPPTFLPMMGLGGPAPQAWGMNQVPQLGPSSPARFNPNATTPSQGNGVMSHLATLNMGGTGFNGFNLANPFANLGNPGIFPA